MSDPTGHQTGDSRKRKAEATQASAGGRVRLSEGEREVIGWWDDGRYGCLHKDDVCPTPEKCREKYGLHAAVEAIVAARVGAALREAAERLPLMAGWNKYEADTIRLAQKRIKEFADDFEAGEG